MSEAILDIPIPVPTQLKKELPTITEGVRLSDPRDYIASSKLEKTAEAIDPKHRLWEGAGFLGILLHKTDDMSFAAGMIIDPGNKDTRVMIAGSIPGKEDSFSEAIDGVDRHTAELVISFLKEANIFLPSGELYRYALDISLKKDLIKQAGPVKASVMLAEMIMGRINNIGKNDQDFQLDMQNHIPTDQQKEQLIKLLGLASTKLKPDDFNDLIEKVNNDIKWIDRYFNEGVFPNAFLDIAKFILEKHPNLRARFFSEGNNTSPKHFPIENLATRNIESVEQMESVLTSIPIEPSFSWRNKNASNQSAEFVELDHVVGGSFPGGHFSIEDESRDSAYLFKMTQAAQNGKLVLNPLGMPLRIHEYGGKYYMEQDGRHRISVLKALGVPFAPMLVTHFRDQTPQA